MHPYSPSDLALCAILLAIVGFAGGILVKRMFWDNRK
jgi:hypothetical protein